LYRSKRLIYINKFLFYFLFCFNELENNFCINISQKKVNINLNQAYANI